MLVNAEEWCHRLAPFLGTTPIRHPEPMSMLVTSLRRYPVKSMGGESLECAEIDARGLVGDRWYAVEDDQGHLASGKTTRRFRRRDRVFDFAADTGPGGVSVHSGDRHWVVGDADLDRHLSEVMEASVRVAAERPLDGPLHQDAGQVSLVGTASLGWCRDELGVDADVRRLRANIVVETDEPFVEESWIGVHLGAGTATLRVVERIERCRMVDLAQDGVPTTARFLKSLAPRDLCLGVYADVEVPGRLCVGAELEVGTRQQVS